ncbi:hypothetical protein EST38_g7952 [Candolleomyces aberdarensis]|uniref:Uncharacterized protein n=1 Tax=Candolleomyces aberdarensis TaxID=2316362 RepID=A0A4Q2DGN7_9AGAR|nr:hypothetical protein EST38_g7952 [Candolleomyces aberdarensis]
MLGKVRSASSFEDYHHRARSDISRLLDPSYTTYSQQKTYSAYVDAQGNMHDPDYRQFPLIQQASQYSATRRTLNATVTRPHWELVDEDALLLDDDEDLLLQPEDSYYPKRNSFGAKSTVSTPRTYPSARRSHSPSGGMRLYPRSTAGFSGAILTQSEVSPPTSWSSSSSSESSSPSSTCSSVLRSRSQEASCRIASSLKRKRRRSTATSGSDKENKKVKKVSEEFDDDEYLYSTRNQEETVFEEEDEEDEMSRRREPEDDTVPTCGESLKKQWQAWSLRIRFGMFRAERRIKRRVQSLI